MSSKFLESDEIDSKIFAGRCLTLLGEILKRLSNIEEYLEDTFHVPQEYQRKNLSRETQQSYEQDDRDIYDYEDED